MSRQTLPRFEALVVNAIRRLQAAQGSTACEIANYLSNEYDFGGPEVKRQIQLAIKRGISYGIIQKSRRGYITCDLTVPPLGLEVEETDCMRCIANNKTKPREQKGSRSRKRTRSGKKRKSKSHRSKSGKEKRRGRKMKGAKRASKRPGSQASHMERRARSMSARSRSRARSESQATDGKPIGNDDGQIDGRRSSLKKRAKAAAGRRLRAMSRRAPGSNRTSKSQKKSPPPDKAKESPPSTTSVTPAEGGKNQGSLNMDCNRSLSPSPMRSVDEIGGDSNAGTENGFET